MDAHICWQTIHVTSLLNIDSVKDTRRLYVFECGFSNETNEDREQMASAPGVRMPF